MVGWYISTIFFPDEDFTVIQQEILMLRDCRHENIVAYLGSYLRYFLLLSADFYAYSLFSDLS